MTERQPIIATWLVADTVENQTNFPQVPGASSSLNFQSVYWRCVVCFFATLVKVKAPGRRVLFTNVEVLPIVDGNRIDRLMDRLGVEVRYLPIVHRAQHPSIRTWNNQFYILDIIREAEDKFDFSDLLVLDADCVWVRPAGGLFADLARFGILTLQLSHREHDPINGTSRMDMKHAEEVLLGAQIDHVPHYVGGEVFACTRELIPEVRRLADKLWIGAVNPSAAEPLLREEGHLLSVVYDFMDIPPGTADAHIKRMWTTFHFHNVTDEDLQSCRCIWHLPAEKKSGFAVLFGQVVRPDSAFWTLSDAELQGYLARIMGVPRRGLQKWTRDLVAKLWEKASNAYRRSLSTGKV